MKGAVATGECGDKSRFFRTRENTTCLCANGNDPIERWGGDDGVRQND